MRRRHGRSVVLATALAATSVWALTAGSGTVATAQVDKGNDPQGGAVAVSHKTKDGRSVPCPAVGIRPRSQINVADRFAPITQGGCRFEAHGELDLNILSVFDEVHFSKCGIWFTLRVDSGGETRIESLRAGGPSPCNDVIQCLPSKGITKPQEGQIKMVDGTARLVTDMCIDTCMGRFVGTWDVALQGGERGGWRLDARNLAVGTSGWRFDGRLKLRSGRPVAIDG